MAIHIGFFPLAVLYAVVSMGNNTITNYGIVSIDSVIWCCISWAALYGDVSMGSVI